MKRSPVIAGVLVGAVVLTARLGISQAVAAPAIQAEGVHMKAAAEEALRAANAEFYVALNAAFTGAFAPMAKIWGHDDDVTLAGPFGGRLEGWTAVGGEFEKVAAMKMGGHVDCRDAWFVVGTDMGYVVCVEEGHNVDADGADVTVRHRATNVFRKEAGGWKLIHHQTDLSPQLEKAFDTEH